MMRIGLERDEPRLAQVVDDPLHVLPIGSHIPSKPRDRLRTIGIGDGAENRPTCARQSKFRDQPVTRGQEQIIESEQVEDELGHRIPTRRSFGATSHLSPSNPIDIIMSYWYINIILDSCHQTRPT